MPNAARIVGHLERKYAEVEEELAGLKAHRAERTPEGLRLKHALECLKVSIRLFDAGWTPRKAKQRRGEINGFGQTRGTVGGTALRIVGEAKEPITTHDIAEAIYERLEIPGMRNAQLDRLRSYLGNFLRNMEQNGFLKVDDSKPYRWSLTQAGPENRVFANPVKPRARTPKSLRRRES